MTKYETKKLRKMSDGKLRKELEEINTEISSAQRIRRQWGTGDFDFQDTSMLRSLKRRKARILTIQNERRLA